jgi:hypothetical protein
VLISARITTNFFVIAASHSSRFFLAECLFLVLVPGFSGLIFLLCPVGLLLCCLLCLKTRSSFLFMKDPFLVVCFIRAESRSIF